MAPRKKKQERDRLGFLDSQVMDPDFDSIEEAEQDLRDEYGGADDND